jgi:hypothetical protein
VTDNELAAEIDAAETAWNAWSRGFAYDKPTFLAGYAAALRRPSTPPQEVVETLEKLAQATNNLVISCTRTMVGGSDGGTYVVEAPTGNCLKAASEAVRDARAARSLYPHLFARSRGAAEGSIYYVPLVDAGTDDAALAVLQPNTGEREAKLEGLLREAADWFERNGCAGELAARIDTTLAEKVSANG